MNSLFFCRKKGLPLETHWFSLKKHFVLKKLLKKIIFVLTLEKKTKFSNNLFILNVFCFEKPNISEWKPLFAPKNHVHDAFLENSYATSHYKQIHYS